MLIPMASGTMVINSQDWQEIGKGINYAQLTGQEYFVMNTPGELKVAEKTLEPGITLLQGTERSVTNVERSSSLQVNRRISIDELSRPDNSEGVMVIQPEFGTDMVSAIPYAADQDLSITFWSEEKIDEIENVTGKVLFYGEFGFDPAEKFGAEHIGGGIRERNFELMERMDYTWAALMSRDWFNPEALRPGRPVIFMGNAEKTAGYVQNSSVDKIKVIGSANMLYAEKLDVITDKDLTVVAKIGRVFTGTTEFKGVYGTKKVEMPHRTYELVLGNVLMTERPRGISATILNKGSTDRRTEITFSTDEEVLTDQVIVPAYSSVSVTKNISSNLTEINLSMESNGFNFRDTYNSQQMNRTNLTVPAKIELKDWNYSRTNGNLTISFTNKGEKRAWLMVQAMNKSQRIGLDPGQTRKTSLTFLDSRPEEIRMYLGEYRSQFSYSRTVELEPPSTSDTLAIILLTFLFLLTLSAVLFIWKGDKISDLLRDALSKVQRRL